MVSIVVQPLQRTLSVPQEGMVVEGQSYMYKLSLTTVPLSNVAIKLNVVGRCAISNVTRLYPIRRDKVLLYKHQITW